MLRPTLPALFIIALIGPASAGSSLLEGSWTGEGIVQPRSGEPELLTCKVDYRQTSETVHRVAASCTSPSFAFEQTGELTTVREGRYVGEFENAQYQIHGKLRVLISDEAPDAQALTFTSDQATGKIALKRF
jgi:hypothetical protein